MLEETLHYQHENQNQHFLYAYEQSRDLSWIGWVLNTTRNFGNETKNDIQEALNASLQPALDVDINGVRATIFFNLIVFVALALLYECLRKWFPSVYASRQISSRRMMETSSVTSSSRTMETSYTQESDNIDKPTSDSAPGDGYGISTNTAGAGDNVNSVNANATGAKLGDSEGYPGTFAGTGSGYVEYEIPNLDKDTKAFRWILPILGVSWRQIYEVAGLDAYFFLRYIHMCYRITSVTAIWGMLFLFPTYYTGTNGAESWYHFSMANVNQGDRLRIWAAIIYIYIFSGFVFYVMKNELAHFVELRLDFLGKEVVGVNPQHHYSIMVENLPECLRSDRALFDYFNQLFPGKVHSANVILHLPDLEALSVQKELALHNLEKAIARYEATGERPTHIMGRPRINCCDIQLSQNECIDNVCHTDNVHDMNRDGAATKGTVVDSIQCYSIELENANRDFIALQKKKMRIAEASNRSLNNGGTWFSTVSRITDVFIDENDNDDHTYKAMKQPDRKVSKIGLRLGLDFIMYGIKMLNVQMGKALSTDDVSRCMSGTGFVTFFDLASVTYAAGLPLSHGPKSFMVTVAPEARDLEWSNVHHTTANNTRRETTANIILILGAFFWSIPLTLIQALASAEEIAEIQGMGWVLTCANGKMKMLVNAYLPVVLLLSLIMILPLIFQWVAITYEKRKTKSDIDQSVVGRYFYYQLANIYITVSAGSVWKSAAGIIQQPSYFLQILGNSLPTVVGYFLALLVTKILAGLPMILLRIGALFRYVLLRIMHQERYLTQRELDQVYRVESLRYAWEYPNQLMIIVICFTYACISPVILIFGALFFSISLMVFKKQVLCVYIPKYESGGNLFPFVVNRTILGLICGQFTFIGYCTIRGAGLFQTLALTPLVYISFWMMRYYNFKYTGPSTKLTLERTIELDRELGTFLASSKEDDCSSSSSLKESGTPPQLSFSSEYYKQPYLTQPIRVPLPYRHGREDRMTTEARLRLSQNRSHMWTTGNRSHLI